MVKKVRKQSRKAVTLTKIAQCAKHLQETVIHIKGTSPLIMDRYGESAKRKVVAHHIRDPLFDRNTPKVPAQLAAEALHIIGKRPKVPQDYLDLTTDDLMEHVPLEFLKGVRAGLPAAAIKKCIARSGKSFKHAMTDLATWLYVYPVHDTLVEVKYSGVPIMRCDRVKIGKGTLDMAYRPELRDWEIEFRMRYNSDQLSIDQVVSLLVDAGTSVGLGQWSNFRNGTHGAFEVAGVYYA